MSTHTTDAGWGNRLLIYGHDTYGLGHLRRNLAIAHHLSQAIPDLSTLLLTGSPIAQNFWLPDRTDYVKLPSVVKIGDEQYRARDINLPPDRVTSLRAAVIAETASYFAPHVFLVDHSPLGMKGELLLGLRRLRRDCPSTRLVLGLRDILDEPAKVRAQWLAQGVYDSIEELYDAILIYGQADIFDPVKAYAFPRVLAARTHFCGYIQREEPRGAAKELRAELGVGADPFVLVTTGGGGDGMALENAVIDAFPLIRNHHPILRAVIVTGPLLPDNERTQLERCCPAGSPITVLPFHADMPGLMRAADLVVSMGGYNSMCEIVSSCTPALIVPRATPRKEQHIRAHAFAQRGLVDMLPEAELTPDRLARAMRHALSRARGTCATKAVWDGGGLTRIATHIADLLPARANSRRRASA